jgi:DNA-binding PadR family transcriptional regulator
MFHHKFSGHSDHLGRHHHAHAMHGRAGKRGGHSTETAGSAPSGRGGFGRRGGGGGGGGGGRVFGPGDLRLLILASISEKPRHGYELIKDLETQFGGGYSPSPGSVYPTLTLLEELGYVRATTSEGAKRLFEITAEGNTHLQENESALNSARKRMEMAARAVSGEMPPQEIHHAMHTLKGALSFHRGGWEAAEITRVAKIIEDAAEAISRRPDHE